MVVRGADVYRRQAAPHVAPEPKPKPKPAPAPHARPQVPPLKAEKKPYPEAKQGNPFQGGAFHGGAAPPPPPKPKHRRQVLEQPHAREERRQEQHQRQRRKAPVKPAIEEDERAHDQQNIDAAVSNNRKTAELRKQLAQRNRDRKAARETIPNESRAGKMPSGSAHIPNIGDAPVEAKFCCCRNQGGIPSWQSQC